MAERVVCISAVYDLTEQLKGGVCGEIVFFENRFEGTFFPAVAEFHCRDVEGHRL